MNRKDRRAAGKHRTAGTSGGLASPELASVFAAAVRAHQAGHLAEAEAGYRQVLALAPDHPASLYYLGIVAQQTGHHAAAVDLIGKAIRINDRNPEWRYHLGLALHALGRLDEAATHYRRAISLAPDYGAAHMNLGNVLDQQGQPDAALACYERVRSLQPNAAVAHYNIANVLARQGRLDDAAANYRRAIEADANLAEAWNNLGNILKEQGKMEAAADHFRRALALRPDLADAHSNLGALLAASGRFDEAVAHLRRAVEVDASLVEAHNNLGNVHLARGQLDEARAEYQRAVELQPGFAEGYENLARVLIARGEPDAALALLRRVFGLRESEAAKALVVHCLKALRTTPAGDVRDLVLRALSENWGWAHDLEEIAARAVKENGAVGACIERAAQAWPRRLTADELFGSSGLSPVAADDLLVMLLRSALVADLALERFLTSVRAVLLEMAETRQAQALSSTELRFACALAQQCFTNEYVFAVEEREQARVEEMRQAIETALDAGAEIGPWHLAAVASYVPLHALQGASRLCGRSWPEPVSALLRQQIEEIARERDLRARIPCLGTIANETSRLVQQQYEENPYPRWVRPAPAQGRVRLADYLREKFPRASFEDFAAIAAHDVLIAGCGTGRQAIETAQRLADARVLAIDLSRASLAYAARKTSEMGLDNIDYAQADLLELPSAGRTFDLIEASGVLHHLADPAAGWRALLSVLRPGGVMFVGLYSRLARQDVGAARAFIADRGYGSSADEIRRCRQALVADEGGDLARKLARMGDFWTTSSCRDLLFHVQEQQTSIGEIDAFLAEDELEFLGFELDPSVLQRFRSRFPGEGAAADLANWDAFEREHPRLFLGMYQFWLRKRVAGTAN